jgi:hypothetical protein
VKNFGVPAGHAHVAALTGAAAGDKMHVKKVPASGLHLRRHVTIRISSHCDDDGEGALAVTGL